MPSMRSRGFLRRHLEGGFQQSLRQQRFSGGLALFPGATSSSVHIWFPRPVVDGELANHPAGAVRAWIAIIVLWVLGLVVLRIHAMFFLVEGSSVNGPEVISTVAFAVVGMFFMLIIGSHCCKISARPPVPSVPLSIDMERLTRGPRPSQRFFTVFWLGRGKCFNTLPSQLKPRRSDFRFKLHHRLGGVVKFAGAGALMPGRAWL